MSDTTQKKPESTLFTVEIIHGQSEELNALACTIVKLGVESVVACARVQLLNREHAPEVKLQMPVQA